MKDMCSDYCEYVLDILVPGVEQPYGHSCGMACNINAALALKSGSHKALVDDGIGVALYEHEMPPRGKCTNLGFCCSHKSLG